MPVLRGDESIVSVFANDGGSITIARYFLENSAKTEVVTIDVYEVEDLISALRDAAQLISEDDDA
jgi:uncharacterized protein with ACT and thioredoxin-like domain